jgi:hypothetical protein
MASEPIATVVRMMESLPEPAQNRVADHLRDYLTELQDELRWDETLAKSQPKLAEMARRAKQQIAEGKAHPLNFNEL